MNGVEVYLSFYLPGREINERTVMPSVPNVGQRLCWTLEGDGGHSFFSVKHVTWVCDDQDRSVWHAEIGLGA